MINGCFGSQADLNGNTTRTAASGGKAVVQKPKLQNPNLNVCFHQERSFKTAVSDVIRARGVMKIAKKAGINRSTVFKTLKPETRTSFTTFHALLRACDINFSTQPVLNIKRVTARKKAKNAIRR